VIRWAWLMLMLMCWPLASVADDALAEVMRMLAAVPTMEGTFREEKTLAVLQEPLVTTGRCKSLW